MALSGTVWGSFTGISTSVARPYITWSATQSIANNRSVVTATLYFVRYDGFRSYNNIGKKFTVSIDGSSTSQTRPYDMGPNGKVSKIMTISRTVSHNSNGTKSLTISASGSTGLSNLGSVSLSGSITLDTIPRASGFTAFSLSNTTLNTDTANAVTYTLDRKSSSFSHRMTLKIGSKTIKSWTDSGTGSRSEPLTAAQVNTIISSRPNHTSGTLTLTMQTRSGSTNIGSPVSRTRSFSISTSVAPSASNISVSIAGSGRDKTINRFIQGITKVTSSFTRSAGYGATISSSTIVVRRVSGAANSQTINSRSGTTAHPVTLSGQYEAIGTVKDSRGRTATTRTTFTVEAYEPPKIEQFVAYRYNEKFDNTFPSTTVVSEYTVVSSNIGTLNPTTVIIKGKERGGPEEDLRTISNDTSGRIHGEMFIHNQSDASSFLYTLIAEDSFGNKSEAQVTVGTAFIELSIARGEGIGVGKVWEQGALDVGGNAYIVGDVELTGRLKFISDNNFDTPPRIETTNAEGRQFLGVRSGGGADGASIYVYGNEDTKYPGEARILVNEGNTRLIANGDGVRVIGELRNNSSGYNNGLALGEHNITNATGTYADSLVIYSSRKGDARPLIVRSHVDKNNYRNDLLIANNGVVFMPTTYDNTSTNTANMRMGGTGQILRVTSTARDKLLPEPITENKPLKILDIIPKTWYDRNNTEKYASILTKLEANEEVTEEELEEIEGIRRIPGLIAEEVESVGLDEFVEYDEDGKVIGIMYDRLWILLIPIVKEILTRLNNLEGEVNGGKAD